MSNKNNKHNLETLLQTIKNNDESVLQNIYSKVYPKVEYYILTNNGSKDQAKDVFQDAFIAMWNNIKQDKFLVSQGSVEGYLYKIAKYKWIDVLRSSEFKLNDKITNDYREEYDIEMTDTLEKDESINRIMKTLDILSIACKKLLELFYFEKRTLEEIAITMNIESASVRNKKYRCMQKLRSLILNEHLEI